MQFFFNLWNKKKVKFVKIDLFYNSLLDQKYAANES